MEKLVEYKETGYLVSKSGRVVNSRGNELKQALSSNGYMNVVLSINGKQVCKTVHQLVAECYLNHKPCGYKVTVNHIDSNKLNNNLSNLELLSSYENTMKGKHIKNSWLPKYVTCYDYHRDKSKKTYAYCPIVEGKQVVLKRSLDLEEVLSFKYTYENQ